MTTQLVIGLGYGDEGKGLTTDYLCRQADRPLVVRFSGGHQAGHTVVTEAGIRHVFSNFGAGTLAGAPTFWSRNCTFHPIGYRNEREALLQFKVDPILYIDGLAPVTTPYDVLYNRSREQHLRHGSCGLGFGATVARHEGPARLHVIDLFDPFVLEQKLAAVAAHYLNNRGTVYEQAQLNDQLSDLYDAVEYVRKNLPLHHVTADLATLSKAFDGLIFEGSQGLLLDQEFGYFPNVTRAYVSSRNALQLISQFDLPAPTFHYVTRAYQTRHGNGPLTNEHLIPKLHPTPRETNVYNPWQGEQRRSLLDVDQLKFALKADNQYAFGQRKKLVITCLDQLDGPWFATQGERRISLSGGSDLGERLGFVAGAVYTNASEVGALTAAT